MLANLARFGICLLAGTWLSAGDPIYRSMDGTWQKAETYHLKNAQAKVRLEVGKLALSVTYEDVDNATGAGFDDPSLGATRRATLESALLYIASALNNTGNVDILALTSLNVGAGTALATAGPVFEGRTGLQAGYAFEHLTTGVDPNSSVNDMRLQVDFGYNYNSGTGAPAADQYDLFTVLLHEITHGLGVISVANGDGSNSTGFAFVTPFERLLYSGSGSSLFASNGTFSGSSDMLLGKQHGVVFRGSAAMAYMGAPIPVFAPNLYITGSSLGHWTYGLGDSCMQPQTSPGVTQRTYGGFELAVLRDIGYDVSQSFDLVYTWVSNSADFESTVIVNNPGLEQVEVTLVARRGDGSEEATDPITIAPNGFMQATASSLFPTLGEGPGYTVTATSSSPDLTGRWVTNDRPGETPSQGLAVRRSTRSTQRAGNNLNLGFLPGNANYQSAPVLVNLTEDAVDMDVYFYDEAGNHVNTVSFSGVQPLRPQVVAVVGADAGDQYAVASVSGSSTGVVFVFNGQNQTAIGNATALSVFTPPQ